MEVHLKKRLGELFKLKYDLLLYDVTTVKTVVETMEKRYGQSDRVWVMDRGMVSFAVTVESTPEGHAHVAWSKVAAKTDWNTLSPGCYLLRTARAR